MSSQSGANVTRNTEPLEVSELGTKSNGEESPFKWFITVSIYKKGEFYAEIESLRGEDLRIIFDNTESEIKFINSDTK